jgi:cyclic pyranopterin phosphate synthase
MDVGESNDWSIENVITSDEIRNIISSKYKINKLSDEINSTSERWNMNNYQAELAFISSISKPFCANCDRGRISADGKFFTCLFSTNGHDLLKIIRAHSSDEKVLEFFQDIWEKRNDHYSEIRFNQKHLQNKIEMSYIGG